MDNSLNRGSIENVDIISKIEKIGFKERVSFGIGDFGTNLMYALMVTFLTYFYTNIVVSLLH